MPNSNECKFVSSKITEFEKLVYRILTPISEVLSKLPYDKL